MAPRSGFSAQTIAVFGALAAEPARWQHGYAIGRRTGLKSGSLYPILIRLADRGLLEASWEEEQPAGRPRRHLYRLTADGLARASAVLEAAPARPEVAVSKRRRRLAERTATS